MRTTYLSLLLCASLVLPTLVAAQSNANGAPAKQVTAVCRSPTGATLLGGAQSKVEPDGFGGGLFTYSWTIGDASATIVSQSGTAAGSVPTTEAAAVVQTADFVTFFVFYEKAVWVHSLFLDKKTVLISRHVTSDASKAPVGGLFTASCSVSVK